MSPEPQGKIITFYSYKGGTGRTMALANVACLLARRQTQGLGRGILMIDWDLEAPGLHRFFHDRFKNHFASANNHDQKFNEKPGLINLFRELSETISKSLALGEKQTEDSAIALINKFDLEPYILPTDIPHLYLLKAGRFDEEYANYVSTFQWEELYNRSPWLFKAFAARLASEFRYVLIDSRTGLTDISGICTMLMPERLVVVFTPNRQSLIGVLELIPRATNYRRHSDDSRPLVVFPLVSRIDMSERDLYELWRNGEDSEQEIFGYQQQLEKLFKEVYDLPICNLEGYFNEVQIQHVPSYAFGEEIAVLVERGGRRLSLTRSYENFMERLVKLVGPWDEPAVSSFKEFDVFLSHNAQDKPIVREIAQELKQRGLKPWVDEEQIPPGRWFQEVINQALREVKSVAILIGPSGLGQWQTLELKSFISQAVEAGIPVIPVLLPGVDHVPEDLGYLQQLNWVRFEKKVNDSEALDKLVWGVTGKRPQPPLKKNK